MAEKPMQMTSEPSPKPASSGASEPKSSSLDLDSSESSGGARWYHWPIVFVAGAVVGFVLGVVLI